LLKEKGAIFETQCVMKSRGRRSERCILIVYSDTADSDTRYFLLVVMSQSIQCDSADYRPERLCRLLSRIALQKANSLWRKLLLFHPGHA